MILLYLGKYLFIKNRSHFFFYKDRTSFLFICLSIFIIVIKKEDLIGVK